MHTFGASAPLKELQKKFGFEPDQVVAVAKELLQEPRSFTNRENSLKAAEPMPA
jgi:transketolase